MILVSAIRDAIQTAYQSVYVKGEIALSLMLLADTDHGKSQLILNYLPRVKHMHVECLSDVSALGIYKAVKDKAEPVTLVIPDFHAIISHRASVVEGTINALMTLLQDGGMKISVGPGESIELKGKRANLITAMTPGILEGRAGKWRRLGFLRRLLPIHYTYSDLTAAKIHESIKSGEYHAKRSYFNLPINQFRQVLIPKPLDDEVQKIAIAVSAQLENRGFTAHKFFRVYVQSRALLQKRSSVNKQDLQDLTDFAEFCNLAVPKQI